MQAGDARAKLTNVCTVAKVKSADDLTEVMRTSGHLLAVLDDHWAMEAALLKMLCGATAESRAGLQMMVQLPSADRDVSILTALAALEVLSASPAMKLSPEGVQASLKFVLTHLGNLHLGISMEVDIRACSKLARGALEAFAFFCCLPEGNLGAKKKVKGRAAYEIVFTHSQKLAAEEQVVSPECFDTLTLFRWLAPTDREAEVAELIKLLSDRQIGEAAPKRARKAGAAASAASSSKDGSASSAGKAKQRAASMFNC